MMPELYSFIQDQHPIFTILEQTKYMKQLNTRVIDFGSPPLINVEMKEAPEGAFVFKRQELLIAISRGDSGLG